VRQATFFAFYFASRFWLKLKQKEVAQKISLSAKITILPRKSIFPKNKGTGYMHEKWALFRKWIIVAQTELLNRKVVFAATSG
jgi:hypothetical protein